MEAVAQGKFTIVTLMDSLPWFKTGGDWTPWRAFLCALYGLPMTDRELEIYRHCTGRRTPPTELAREVWVACGRRARKSATAALIAVWRALFYDYSAKAGVLAPGERGKVPIVAATKKEAKQIRSYALAILKTSNLRCFLETEEPPEESIPLNCGVDIEIVACNIKAGRSTSTIVGLLDEVAFFADDDGANPDKDIVRAVKAGMSRVPGSFIGGFSSPYAPRGILYERYQENYGKDTGILFWKADSLYMSPGVPKLEEEVAEAYRVDPVAAATEYGAEFRKDVMAYVTEDIVGAAMTERGWLPFDPANRYYAFCDPAGGSGSDSMTLAIAHADRLREKVVLDMVTGAEPPFEPGIVVATFAGYMQKYGLRFVEGDRYAGDWPLDRFRGHSIGYQPSERTKSQIYKDWLPALMEKRVDLPDDKRLKSQLLGLDRRPSRGGDIIDHPKNGHDDYCLPAVASVATTRGAIQIESVVAGDSVLVPGGTAKVLWSGQTGHASTLRRGTLVATENHPIFCEGVGFRPLSEAKEDEWNHLSLAGLIRWDVLMSCLGEGSTTDSWGPDAITSASQLRMQAGSTRRVFTSLCGRLIRDKQYRRVMRLTTGITTLSTTTLRTWIAYRRASIGVGRGFTTPRSSGIVGMAARLGTRLQRAASGIVSTLSGLGSGALSMGARPAPAVGLTSHERTPRLFSALSFAKDAPGSGLWSMRDRVWPAERPSPQCDIGSRIAQSDALEYLPAEPVYNLQVEGVECFYADGVLVHNCNAAAGALLKAYDIGLKIKSEASSKPTGTLEEQRAREFQAYLKSLHNPEPEKGSRWESLNRGGR